MVKETIILNSIWNDEHLGDHFSITIFTTKLFKGRVRLTLEEIEDATS